MTRQTIFLAVLAIAAVSAQVRPPSQCNIYDAQPVGQPDSKICATARATPSISTTYPNLFSTEDPFSTALCLSGYMETAIKPGQCGCPNDCGSQFARGKCATVGRAQQCQCNKGWKGQDCSIVSCSAGANPCQNKGKCVNLKGVDVCECPAGFNLMDCSGKDQKYTPIPAVIPVPQYKKDRYNDSHPLFDVSTVTQMRINMNEQQLHNLITGPAKTPLNVQSVLIKNNKISEFVNGTIQTSGAFSIMFAKKSFRFKFDKEFYGQKGMKLKGAQFDSSFIREALTISIAKSIGVPVGRSGYAALYINDMFRGLYVLLEDIKKPMWESRFGTDKGTYCDTNGCEPAGSNYDDVLSVCQSLRPDITTINKKLDAVGYLKTVAVDAMTGNWDGWKNRNNFAMYRPDPSKPFIPFRFDLDGAWGFDFWQPELQSSFDVFRWLQSTKICPNLLNDAKVRATYVDIIKKIASLYVAGGPIESFAKELHAFITPIAVQDMWHGLDFDYHADAFKGALKTDISVPHKTQSILSFITNRRTSALQQIARG